jgi:hypothetical protein
VIGPHRGVRQARGECLRGTRGAGVNILAEPVGLQLVDQKGEGRSVHDHHVMAEVPWGSVGDDYANLDGVVLVAVGRRRNLDPTRRRSNGGRDRGEPTRSVCTLALVSDVSRDLAVVGAAEAAPARIRGGLVTELGAEAVVRGHQFLPGWGACWQRT